MAIKSGIDEAGRDFGMASENIRVENCTVDPEFDNGSTNGISIGSEMSGGVRNVTVSGLVCRGVAVGVYIKSAQGRGGVVENVTFENIFMERVLQPIRFAIDYPYRRRGLLDATESDSVGRSEPNDDDDGSGVPHLRYLAVKNLTAAGALTAGSFEGLSDSVSWLRQRGGGGVPVVMQKSRLY